MRVLLASLIGLVMLFASTDHLLAKQQNHAGLLPLPNPSDIFHSNVFFGIHPAPLNAPAAPGNSAAPRRHEQHASLVSASPWDTATDAAFSTASNPAQFFGIAGAMMLLVLVIGFSIHEHRKRRFAEAAAQQRMSELALINRQATAGEMSAAIAHELNQPLGIILNNAEAAELILGSHAPDLTELKELLADIRRSDRRASDIIRHLRALLSHHTSKFAEIDLNTVAREAMEIAGIQAHARGVTLHVALSPDALPVIGDSIQLQQVFLNLILNGIEAVSGRTSAYRDIVISTSLAEGKFAEASVSDSGPGIAEENFEQVFEPFFSTKENGMGVGLSLCRTIVDTHFGSIWAANGISGGAIFRFRLPLTGRRSSHEHTTHRSHCR